MNSTAELEKILKKMESNINLQPYLKSTIIPLIKSAVEKNFVANGRAGNGTGLFDGGSGHWEPLAASTKKRYEKEGISPLIATLARKGNLKDSIVYSSSGNSIFIRAGGSDVVYASALHYGTDYMPARPFITLTQADIDQIVRVMQSLIEQYI